MIFDPEDDKTLLTITNNFDKVHAEHDFIAGDVYITLINLIGAFAPSPPKLGKTTVRLSDSSAAYLPCA